MLLLCAATVDAVCPFTELWIDSVNLAGISGCFVETIYFGLHATTVWTLGGVDIAPSGTTGIIAEMVRVSPPKKTGCFSIFGYRTSTSQSCSKSHISYIK